VTTEIIELAFPNAHVVGLRNRTEAVQALTRPSDAEGAIDAYASDEVILTDMLRRDLPAAGAPSKHFQVQPPLYGYSREDYVVVVYNQPTLMEAVDQWLDSPAGREAADALLPRPAMRIRLASWLAWGAPGAWLWGTLFALALLLGSLSAWWLWRNARPWLGMARLPGQAAMPADGYDGEGSAPATGTDTSAPLRELTQREHQVLELIVHGRSNKQVARELGIEVRTVEAHRRNIYGKLGVKNTAELVQVAIDRQTAPSPPQVGPGAK
jgi:DNA-binding CsgD family transcriptional regulator